ncbi:MAG: histidine phosphatase family protein [Gammaproteobacteria bacterium]|nr:histidine phosphatase family protein [Gammaproteobacteria bacterium]
MDFLRHGEPEGGDILRGRINPALTALGWQQMQHATGLTQDCQPTKTTPDWTGIISSPLARCCDFATTVAAETKLDLEVDAGWQEIDYGDWDGLPIDEWRILAADQFRAFRDDFSALAPPNGERFVDFRDRILKVWGNLADYPNGTHLLVVTHGGVLRIVLPTVLGMPLNRSFPLFIPFACYSRIALDVSGDRCGAALIFHNATGFEARPFNPA